MILVSVVVCDMYNSRENYVYSKENYVYSREKLKKPNFAITESAFILL